MKSLYLSRTSALAGALASTFALLLGQQVFAQTQTTTKDPEKNRQSVQEETARALAAGEIQHGPLVDFYSLVESKAKPNPQIAQKNSDKNTKPDSAIPAENIAATSAKSTAANATPHSAAK